MNQLACDRIFFRHRALLLIVIFVSLVIPQFGWAQEAASESQVKAAFLYKFTTYVDWPDSAFERPDAPLTIGVMDADDVEHELLGLVAGRRIKNRVLLVRHLDTGDALSSNQILFVGKASVNRLGSILSSVKSNPVLTVTEVEAIPTQGSVINFILIDDQVRFQISLVAAQQKNLKISSRLLSVAQQVVTEGQ
ncbi:MAG TPA: YfiR family protein [Rhodocyclaceae bacterium]|nr:YfiR family protein [Rhodocyclaceae bacterium]